MKKILALLMALALMASGVAFAVESRGGASDFAASSLVATSSPTAQAGVSAVWVMECVGADGRVKWTERWHNLVTTEGLNTLLDKTFKASSYTAAWYVGLKGTGAPAAGDTMASHAGWSEITAYSNATRPALTLGTPSGGSVSNTASKAILNINGSATVYGCIITSDSTKGGSTGLLFSAGNFAVERPVIAGDTLNVTQTLTMTAL